MENKLDFKLLKDVPILKSDKNFYDFYHSYVSPTLKEILENKSYVQTIGLFGSWGSGKSTIIKNLEEECLSTYPVFIFDAWKYQADPLRRTFIMSLFRFINDKKLWIKGKELPETFLDNIYETNTTSISEKVTPNKKLGFWKNVWFQLKNLISNNPLLTILFATTILCVLIWIAGQYFLGESNPIIAFILKIPGIISLSSTGLFVIGTIVAKSIESMTNKVLTGLNIDFKTQTIITTREFLNSPEQFEDKFEDIISRLNKKIIVVFDNIDRVQGDMAIESLSTIKTFVGSEKNRKVVFIVPCDPDAISKQIKIHYASKNIESAEYLRKLFNVILWTPDFIGADLEDYTSKLIKQLGKSSTLLDNDELVLVINHAFKSNPREIKQFLNNLVSFLILASKTEVWRLIKENIPYMAKVLILRQKFPKAYLLLKEKWFTPENIWEETAKDKELRDFMINTSNTTTNNAEPFIYLKKPNQSKDVIESENLGTALIAGDIEKSKELISKNIDKIDKLVDYILSLYLQYKDKPDWMFQIFNTHSLVFEQLSVKAPKIAYYDRTLETVDKYLWQNFTSFPINYFFDNFICNTKTKNVLRKNIIERYVSAIGSKEVSDDKLFAKKLIENLIKTEINMEKNTLDLFRKNIEDVYSLDLSIMGLFNSVTLQKKYITKQALDKLIRTINYDNFGEIHPTILSYKKYIEDNEFGEIYTEIINNIFQSEGARNPTNSLQKQVLIRSIGELLKEPFSIALTTEKPSLETLGGNIIASYNNLDVPISERYYFINTFLGIRPYLSEENSSQIEKIIYEFVKTVEISIIEDKVLSNINGYIEVKDFITQYLEAIKERAVSLGGESLGILYESAINDEQQSIINLMIVNRSDLGFSFINSLKNIPNRQETILKILEKINTMPTTNRKDYYVWISGHIKQTDNVDIKNLIFSHINSLLKSDNPIDEEIGYNFFNDSITVISDTIKREIAKNVIEWLRTPGKIIVTINWFSLKAVAIVFNKLQITQKGDFVSILFNLLDKSEERDCLDMAIKIIEEIKPKWSNYETNFVDFREKIKGWVNIENRNYVISELKKNVSKRPSKKEKAFWKTLDKIERISV